MELCHCRLCVMSRRYRILLDDYKFSKVDREFMLAFLADWYNIGFDAECWQLRYDELRRKTSEQGEAAKLEAEHGGIASGNSAMVPCRLWEGVDSNCPIVPTEMCQPSRCMLTRHQ